MTFSLILPLGYASRYWRDWSFFKSKLSLENILNDYGMIFRRIWTKQICFVNCRIQIVGWYSSAAPHFFIQKIVFKHKCRQMLCFLQYEYCTSPYCDFDIKCINCIAVLSTKYIAFEYVIGLSAKLYDIMWRQYKICRFMRLHTYYICNSCFSPFHVSI